MRQVSAEEVLAEASDLHRRWPSFGPEEKRRIIESIVEKITLTTDEFDVTWSYLPSSEELTKRQRNLCAMLPFCDRSVTVARKDVAPVWTRSFPIAKEPTTLGQRLRKKRFIAGLRQDEAAVILGVSNRTLSLWETDRVCPAWAFQPRLVAYLGYNPFTDPTLGSPKGNEPSCVAFLSLEVPATIGQKIKGFRLKSRKTRRQLAREWGVSTKTLWGWETGRWQPSALCWNRLSKFTNTIW